MDEPYDLPEGWEWTTVGSIFTINYGKGLVKSKRDKQGKYGVYGSGGEVGKHSTAITDGPTLIIGRKGTVGEVTFSGEKCWPIDTTYFIDTFPEEMPIQYWYHQLKHLQLGQQDKSTAIPGLNRDDIYDTIIPLAPLNEQRRIVAKLETLLPQVNSAKEHLAKVPPLMKQFRQSLLNAACTGKLTQEWRKGHPDVEPASELLKRIRKERIKRYEEECKRAKKEGRRAPKKPCNLEPQEIDNSELPELPERWVCASLGSIIEASKEKQSPPFNNSTKYIGLEHIEKESSKLSGIGKGSDVRSTKSVFHSGDVLYGKLRPYLNKTYIAGFDGICSTDIIVYRKNQYIESEYLMGLLSSHYVVSYANQNMEGVQHPRISIGKLAELPVPLPPLIEQRQIIQVMNEIITSSSHVKKSYDCAIHSSQYVSHSILNKAFRGGLVPQDPKDEPASGLLERIKGEREKARKGKKKW